MNGHKLFLINDLRLTLGSKTLIALVLEQSYNPAAISAVFRARLDHFWPGERPVPPFLSREINYTHFGEPILGLAFRTSLWSRTGIGVAIFIAVAIVARQPLHGQNELAPLPDDEFSQPAGSPALVPFDAGSMPVQVAADYCQTWSDGRATVYLLRGNCSVQQGPSQISGQEMVVWERPNGGTGASLNVYAERNATLDRPGQTLRDSTMLTDFSTTENVSTKFRDSFAKNGNKDALFTRARTRLTASMRGSAAEQPPLIVQGELSPDMWAAQQPTGPLRRVRIFRRSSQPYQLKSRASENISPPEQIWTITGGVNVLVDGLKLGQQESNQTELGTIDLSADRMVIWTAQNGSQDVQSGQLALQSPDQPLQVYMEGNIVIRQGGNIIRATHAFFDARDDRAVLMNAELKAYIPQVDEYVRVRAERLRQLSREQFHAQNAWTTTSPYGEPGYRLQATDIFVDQRMQTWGRRQPGQVNPYTGAMTGGTIPWITSLNNELVVGNTTILRFPRLSFPADDPGIPLRRASVRHDRIFGFQVKTVWDMSRLLGRETPPGLDWNLQADVLTDRGPGVGTFGTYENNGLAALPGLSRGDFNIFYQRDDASDNLGNDRRNLVPGVQNRGRATWRHQQQLANGAKLFGEFGFLSDRNFLEQYYEPEFDREKDIETSVRIKQDFGNSSVTGMARVQLNDFETTTEWLPRADLFTLSQPLFGDMLTWSQHSSVGYAQLRPGEAPSDPTDIYTPLSYITRADGLVAMTRQQLDMPIQLGRMKVVPYAMGEAAHWTSDFNGNEISRLVGMGGVRSSISFWKIYPQAHSRIFNVNGINHKITLTGDYSYTDSSEPYSNIPQYNEIDENAQERFRNRFIQNTFGGALPATLDPRSFAFRSGAGSSVTAPWHEIIDDQQVARFNIRQRWQTHVGPPDRLRVKDWMVLDVGASYFPEAGRDNFGESVGLINGFYRWNVGDRTSIVASAVWDMFENSENLWNVGLLSQRSRRGSIYLGYRQVEAGPLESQIVTGSYSYQMSEKWVSTFGTAFDVAEGLNRGQSMTISRIGLDWIFHLGMNYDQSKDNVGFAFMLEPRFGKYRGLGTPLSSLLGLEQ